jgi:hypothetical protein
MSAPCVTSSYLYLSEWPQPFPASSKRNSIFAQERFSQTRGSCGARLRRRDISDTGPAHRCSDWFRDPGAVMIDLEASAERKVNAPPERVFALIADPRRPPEPTGPPHVSKRADPCLSVTLDHVLVDGRTILKAAGQRSDGAADRT